MPHLPTNQRAFCVVGCGLSNIGARLCNYLFIPFCIVGTLIVVVWCAKPRCSLGLIGISWALCDGFSEMMD